MENELPKVGLWFWADDGIPPGFGRNPKPIDWLYLLGGQAVMDESDGLAK
jgi:hypothetical protein